MRTSKAGIDHIIHFESSGRARLAAYLCPAGVWTIGHGHTSAAGPPEVHQGMVISESEARDIFKRDLRKFEEVVDRLVVVDLEQGQFDALVDLVFNIGEGNFRTSTLLKVLNKRQYDRVPAELMKWVKARNPATGQLETSDGLVRRRRAACVLWRNLDELAPVNVEDTRITPVPVPPPKTMATSKEGVVAATAGVGAAAEVANQVEQTISTAGSLTSGLSALLASPRFYVVLAILLAFAAIWYFRRQRLREEGT